LNKHTVKEIIEKVGPLPFRLVGKWMIQICNILKSEMTTRGKGSFVPLSPSLLKAADTMNLEYVASRYIGSSIRRQADRITEAYWSPEQVRCHDLTIQSTLYSLGIIGYQMTTGTLPFSTNSAKSGHVPKAGSKRPGVPPTLELIIVKLLSSDSTKRFNSPDEIAEIISRMTLNEDETGVKAQKALKEFFKQEEGPSRAPTVSIQMSPSRTSTSASGKSDSTRTTTRIKSSVYQGPPEWEDNLKVTAHTEKVTLTWKTEAAAAYRCKVVKRGSGGASWTTKEVKAGTDHELEVPELEPDTGYSVTIFNETDFVMKSFKTPASNG